MGLFRPTRDPPDHVLSDRTGRASRVFVPGGPAAALLTGGHGGDVRRRTAAQLVTAVGGGGAGDDRLIGTRRAADRVCKHNTHKVADVGWRQIAR